MVCRSDEGRENGSECGLNLSALVRSNCLEECLLSRVGKEVFAVGEVLAAVGLDVDVNGRGAEADAYVAAALSNGGDVVGGFVNELSHSVL